VASQYATRAAPDRLVLPVILDITMGIEARRY
jgi:hypothetical protein